MKYKQLHKYIYFLLLLPALFLLYSCQGDDIPDDPAENAEEMNIRFEVQLPADLRNALSTRGMNSSDEATITTVDVFHFLESTDGKYRGLTEAPIQGSFDAGPPSWVNAKLQLRPDKNSRLVILVNARKTDNYGYYTHMDLDNFLATLILEERGEWYTGTPRPMPMYAITGAVEIKKDIPNGELDNNGNPFGLIRMHAKFNISLNAAIDNFELATVCVFNRKTKGYIPYNEAKWDASVPTAPKATAPHIPTFTTADNIYEPAAPYYSVGTDEAAGDYGKIINKQYVFEVNNAAESNFQKKTALVIGGRYDADADITYYRLDIDATDGNILRNHLYDVEIQSVGSRGYDSAVEAFAGSGRMSAKVVVWNQSTQDITGGKQYRLTVSEDELRFSSAGGQFDIVVSTDYDITDQGFPAGVHINASEISYASGSGWLTLVDVDGSNGDLARTVGIQATAYNGAQRSAKIYVKAGNMTKVINVIQ